MEPLAGYYALGLFIIAVAIAVPCVVCQLRMSSARALVADDHELMAEFDRTKGSRRPLAVFLGTAVGVLVIGMVVATFVPVLIEPAVWDHLVGIPVWSAVIGFPILFGLVGLGVAISYAVRTRARSQLLDRYADQRPDRAELRQAAELLRGGRSVVGVGAISAVAATLCVILGLWWVAALFLAANLTIACSRNPKCL